MGRILGIYLPAAVFVGMCILFALWPAPIYHLRVFIEGHTLASYSVFVLLLFVATVCMPVTIMPIIPVVAPIFGPFLTGVLSVIGWTAGAAVAFLIARTFGRPILERFVPLRKLDEAIAKVPPETRFFTIVLIRMTLPVDIMSYAIGLSTSIAFWPYLAATVIGVTWFSFAIAYMGDAFFSQNKFVLITVAATSLVLFVLSWAILIRHTRRHK